MGALIVSPPCQGSSFNSKEATSLPLAEHWGDTMVPARLGMKHCSRLTHVASKSCLLLKFALYYNGPKCWPRESDLLSI